MTGPAVVKLCDRMMPGENADALAHDVLEAAIAGLRSGIRLTTGQLPCDFTHAAEQSAVTETAAHSDAPDLVHAQVSHPQA